MSHHALGDRAQEDAFDTGPSVRAQDDHLDARILRCCSDDLFPRHAAPQLGRGSWGTASSCLLRPLRELLFAPCQDVLTDVAWHLQVRLVYPERSVVDMNDDEHRLRLASELRREVKRFA